jgi:hypothetical protein
MVCYLWRCKFLPVYLRRVKNVNVRWLRYRAERRYFNILTSQAAIIEYLTDNYDLKISL